MRLHFLMVSVLIATVSTAEAGVLSPVQDETARAECSDCHMAYPPITLPQASWEKIFANLANHFGEDASLDAATTKHVLDYYVNNSNDVIKAKYGKIYEEMQAEAAKAGKNVKLVRPPGILRAASKWGSEGVPERIQDVSRFKRKHRFSNACLPIIKGVMERVKIKSMAMCSGCHAGMPTDGSTGVRFAGMENLSAQELKCLDE